MAKKKVGFASGIGFVLSAAGSAVGIGNLWGFPYKTAKNGGAAFVFVYIACVILIGFVTMLSEIHIGKRAHANPITAYKSVGKSVGWFGLVSIVIAFIISCYYSVLGGYTVKYTMNSFEGNAGILNSFAVNIGEVALYTGVFIMIAIIVVMSGIKDGVEKFSKVLMPTLFVILLVIVVYSLCLGDGVKEGLEFYLKPDFKSLGLEGVLAAMGQAFFSLSIGAGVMITYGSNTGKEVNIVKSTAMICVFDTVVALLAGLAIFPAIAHFDPSLLDKSSGVTLIFSILPTVFDSMGVIGTILSFLFFAMIVIAALTSVISLIETATQFVIQKYKVPRKKSALIVALICFVISIPIGISLGRVGVLEEKGLTLFGLDWFTFFDEVTNTVLMPISALFVCIACGWMIKPKNALQEMAEHGTKEAINPFVKKVYPIMVKYVTPLLIIVIEICGIKAKIESGQIAVVISAYVLLALCIAGYFIFLRNAETGTNDDEIIADELERESQYNKYE